MSDERDVGEPADLQAWLEVNWDPDLAVSEWWQRLGRAGLAAPMLPPSAFGLGLSATDAVRIQRAIEDFGALPAPGGLGTLLAAPTIAAFGTPEQIERYVGDIVTGRSAWCQLFSEPVAGSDLAGLQTRAIRDGDEWVITGQKVWTSNAQYADYGMLIARTDPQQPKHRGISYFAFDMRQPGVDIRPLREMTGRAMFNEVFLTEARVPDAAMIGGHDDGWSVANATLTFERAGLSAGGGHVASTRSALPGRVAGELDRRAGDFVEGPPAHTVNTEGAVDLFEELHRLARRRQLLADPIVRQDLARLHTLRELGRFNSLRVKGAAEQGRTIDGMPNIGKLSMSRVVRLQRDLGLRLAGPSGTLHRYDDHDGVEDELVHGITEAALFAAAPSIYGGSDQVQRNIIGERILGLPKEPGPPRDAPFSQLPRNR